MSESLLARLAAARVRGEPQCVVCLRSGAERRLGPPTAVRLFLHSINLPCVYDKPFQKACMVCERQAAAALQFRRATNLAAQVQRALTQLGPSAGGQAARVQLERHLADPAAPAALETLRLAECERGLRQLRARTALLQTEVLVVSSDSGQGVSAPVGDAADEDTLSNDETFGECSGLYVIPDERPRDADADSAPNSFAELEEEPEIKLEPIVILDDEDPIRTPARSMVPRTNTAPRVNRANAIPREKVIFMTNSTHGVKGTSGAHGIPGANGTRGAIAASGPNGTIEAGGTSGAMGKDQIASSDIILHPIVFNSGVLSVPSLNAKILNGHLVTQTDSSLMVETPRIALQDGPGIEFISDPLRAANVLKAMSHHDSSKVHIYTQTPPADAAQRDTPPLTPLRVNSLPLNPQQVKNLPSNSLQVNNLPSNSLQVNNLPSNSLQVNNLPLNPLLVNNISGHLLPSTNIIVIADPQVNANVSQSANNAAGAASRKSKVDERGGIDWEAKIPMDLISFVDNNESIIKRARRGAPPAPAPPHLGVIAAVTSLPPDDVIDLC